MFPLHGTLVTSAEAELVQPLAELVTVTVTNSANGCTSSASAEVTSVPCSGNIFPTQTTCSDFTSGTAVNQDSACYQFSTSGGTSTVTNAQPGVVFYYVSLVAPSSSFTVNIV